MSGGSPPTTTSSSREAAPKYSTPSSSAAGSNPSVHQHSGEGTSAASEGRQGLRLRSGTVLAGPSSTVSLDKFLNKILEKARESGKLTVAHCDGINQKINETHEQRLADLNQLKLDTLQFRQELAQFSGFSRSLEENSSFTSQNKSVSDKESVSLRENNSASETDHAADSPSVENLLLDWLETSLTDTSPEESLSSPLEFKSQVHTPNTMADYSKVVKLTSQMVPIFSGEPGPQLSQELQTFLGCCRQAKQCLPEDEQQAFLKILPTRLRGGAYQLLAADLPTTFKEVENRLNAAYLPRETYQELVNRLITARQNPCETLIAFTNRVKQFLTLCKEAAETKYGAVATPAVNSQLEDFAKNALRSGVTNPHLCQYLLTIPDGTLEELTQKALDMEKLQQGAHFTQTPPIQSFPSASPVDQSARIRAVLRTPYTPDRPFPTPPMFRPPPPNTFRRQTPPYSPSNQRLSPPYSAPRYADRRQNLDLTPQITCHFCQKKGHTYSECFKRKNTPFCNICRNYGHDGRDCRSNRQVPGPSNSNRTPDRRSQEQKPLPVSRAFDIKSKCKFCNRRGHLIEECRQKQKWEAKNPGNGKQSTEKPPDRH